VCLNDTPLSTTQVGVRHPILFKTVAEHLIGRQETSSSSIGKDADQPTTAPAAKDILLGTPRGLKDFSPQGLGNAAYAYARQGQLACDVIQRYDGATKIFKATGRLAVYTAGFIDIGETLLKTLFCQVADANVQIHGTKYAGVSFFGRMNPN
jgi:hypothetical protein